jgi:hypothetical protein
LQDLSPGIMVKPGRVSGLPMEFDFELKISCPRFVCK